MSASSDSQALLYPVIWTPAFAGVTNLYKQPAGRQPLPQVGITLPHPLAVLPPNLPA